MPSIRGEYAILPLPLPQPEQSFLPTIPCRHRFTPVFSGGGVVVSHSVQFLRFSVDISLCEETRLDSGKLFTIIFSSLFHLTHRYPDKKEICLANKQEAEEKKK